MEEAVFPMVNETKLCKKSHTDDEHLMTANTKHRVK
jgi:hypothetical protein